MKTGAGKWTVTFRPNPAAQTRLLCFHHAGGGAYGFRSWAERLSRDIEVVAVQLPGRENRAGEPLATSVNAVLDPLVETLSGALDAPFAVFGHSLGAVLGYTLAHRLWSSGAMSSPIRLFISAARVPASAVAEPRPPLSDADLTTRLERWGGTPQALLGDPSMLRQFLRPLRSDIEILQSAAGWPCEPLPIPFTVLRGACDASVRQAHAAAWTALTSAGADQHEISGGHFYDTIGERQLLRLIEATLAVDWQRGANGGG